MFYLRWDLNVWVGVVFCFGRTSSIGSVSFVRCHHVIVDISLSLVILELRLSIASQFHIKNGDEMAYPVAGNISKHAVWI